MTDEPGPFTIWIDGLLDICVAGSVAERLRTVRDDREIVIEFGPTAHCDLVGLSYLAETLERRSSPVRVCGLSVHDLRILRYLAVELPFRTK